MAVTKNGTKKAAVDSDLIGFDAERAKEFMAWRKKEAAADKKAEKELKKEYRDMKVVVRHKCDDPWLWTEVETGRLVLSFTNENGEMEVIRFPDIQESSIDQAQEALEEQLEIWQKQEDENDD